MSDANVSTKPHLQSIKNCTFQYDTVDLIDVFSDYTKIKNTLKTMSNLIDEDTNPEIKIQTMKSLTDYILELVCFAQDRKSMDLITDQSIDNSYQEILGAISNLDRLVEHHIELASLKVNIHK